MAVGNYSQTHHCACGNRLKVFESSGRTAKACSQDCSRRLTRQLLQAPRKVSAAPAVESRVVYQRCCVRCGTAFETVHSSKTYCSKVCVLRSWRDHNPERTLELRKHCYQKVVRDKVWWPQCATCRSVWLSRYQRNPSVCSPECADRWNCINGVRTGAPRINECRHCGRRYASNSHHKKTCGTCKPPESEAAKKARKLKERAWRREYRRTHGGEKARHRAARAGVAYEPINVMKVFERDGWRCQMCGRSTPPERRGTYERNAPELDHIIPLGLRGPHLYSNVQCACRECNGKKGASLKPSQMTFNFKRLTGGGSDFRT